ncbi:hypothetical protein SK1NUM_03690 [Arachnia rubra]|nr:hypothetical protein SK1NUM_03690 [Arachnia rubra]
MTQAAETPHAVEPAARAGAYPWRPARILTINLCRLIFIHSPRDEMGKAAPEPS